MADLYLINLIKNATQRKNLGHSLDEECLQVYKELKKRHKYVFIGGDYVTNTLNWTISDGKPVFVVNVGEEDVGDSLREYCLKQFAKFTKYYEYRMDQFYSLKCGTSEYLTRGIFHVGIKVPLPNMTVLYMMLPKPTCSLNMYQQQLWYAFYACVAMKYNLDRNLILDMSGNSLECTILCLSSYATSKIELKILTRYANNISIALMKSSNYETKFKMYTGLSDTYWGHYAHVLSNMLCDLKRRNDKMSPNTSGIMSLSSVTLSGLCYILNENHCMILPPCMRHMESSFLNSNIGRELREEIVIYRQQLSGLYKIEFQKYRWPVFTVASGCPSCIVAYHTKGHYEESADGTKFWIECVNADW